MRRGVEASLLQRGTAEKPGVALIGGQQKRETEVDLEARELRSRAVCHAFGPNPNTM